MTPPLFSSTSKGYPYIQGTQNASLIDDYALELANKLEAAVPHAAAAGQATIAGTTLASGAAANVAITFPTSRFSVAPIVTATVASAQAGTATLVARVISITTSGASVYVYNAGASSVTFSGSLLVNWAAVQMTPSAANG